MAEKEFTATFSCNVKMFLGLGKFYFEYANSNGQVMLFWLFLLVSYSVQVDLLHHGNIKQENHKLPCLGQAFSFDKS